MSSWWATSFRHRRRVRSLTLCDRLGLAVRTDSMPMLQTRLATVALALGWLAFARAAEQERRDTRPPVPLDDHHQHLFSPELAALMTTTAGGPSEASNRRRPRRAARRGWHQT